MSWQVCTILREGLSSIHFSPWRSSFLQIRPASCESGPGVEDPVQFCLSRQSGSLGFNLPSCNAKRPEESYSYLTSPAMQCCAWRADLCHLAWVHQTSWRLSIRTYLYSYVLCESAAYSCGALGSRDASVESQKLFGRTLTNYSAPRNERASVTTNDFDPRRSY